MNKEELLCLIKIDKAKKLLKQKHLRPYLDQRVYKMARSMKKFK